MEIKRLRRGAYSVGMAPFIDVVFNLMIYFLLTMNFSVNPIVKLDLPEAKSAQQAGAQKYLRVTVDQKERILLNNRLITLSNLRNELDRIIPELDQKLAMLYVDKRVNFGLAIKVMDTLRLSGIKDISVVTEQADN